MDSELNSYAASCHYSAGTGRQQLTGTQWTSKIFGTPGSASGTIAGTVNVTYTESFSVLGSGQLGSVSRHLHKARSCRQPTKPKQHKYPARGRKQYLNQIAFSTPVIDPVLAIQSMGSSDRAEYLFTQSFTILAQGPGHWGGGLLPSRKVEIA